MTKTTTASQLKETVWTQNVLGATGVALSLLLHSSHSSANSCWGGSATLRRLRVDGWVWRRVELWPPLVPSLHVMPSCSRVLRTLNGRLPFFFVFPKAIREIRTSKQWSDSREMDSIIFLLLFQLLPQNSSDKSPLPAKEIHFREHQATAALNKIPHHGFGLTPRPLSPLCPGFTSDYTQLWHNDSPWTHPALSQRASTSEKTKKQGDSDFPFALKLVLERLARVGPAYSHGNCDGTSTILIICASLLANFYDRVLHRSERAVRGITKQTRPQKSHLK